MKYLPEYALEMLNILKNAGYEAYAVGGCVRDALLGTETADIDITTSALPEQIQTLFPHSVRTGGMFFTVTVSHGGGKAEITTYRSESGYSDSRRPDGVAAASSLIEDLKRRDFTVNSLCCDGENIIDLLDGKKDIASKTIRCIGNPSERFGEDALRIMRAFRFSASLGFSIEPETLKAALVCSEKLREISVERIRDELIKTAVSASPENISPLLECGALDFLGLHGSPMLIRLKDIRSDENIRLAAFLYICGKDSVGKLKLSNAQKRSISAIFSIMDNFPPLERNAVKRSMSAFTADDFKCAAEIAAVFFGKSRNYISLCEEIVSSGEPYTLSQLAVNGGELLESGVSGEDIGVSLKHLLDIVIDAPEMNKKDILLHKLK